MKKFLYVMLVAALFFVLLISFISNNDLNPVGVALQQWISLILVLVIPLVLNKVELSKRISVFIPLAIIFSLVGMNWARYSETGGFIFPYYCVLILMIIIGSHSILRYLDSSNDRVAIPALIALIIGTSIVGVFYIQNGITKYNQVVEQFKTKCTTTGSIYSHCDEVNYMRFFPPNNHVTF